MEHRMKNLIWSLSPFVIVLLIQLAAGIMAGEFASAWLLHNFTGGSMDKLYAELLKEDSLMLINLLTTLIYSLATVCLFSGMYYTYFYKKNHTNRDEVVAKGPSLSVSFRGYRLLDLICGIFLLILALTYLAQYLSEVVAVISPEALENYRKVLEQSGLSESHVNGWMMLYVSLLGPIAEELTFRGMTFEYARRSLGFWGANIVQAVLFGIMHMNPMQGVYTFILGMVFGYVYYVTGNIFVPILLHIFYNSGQFVLMQVLPFVDTPVTVFINVLLALLIGFVGLFMVQRCMPEDLNSYAEQTEAKD